MPGIYDLYIKSDIMDTCESFFNQYLEDEGVPDEGLTEDERELIGEQVDYLLDMITSVYLENPDDEDKVCDILVDKLIGMCIVAKMQEARLCRLLNKYIDGKD